MKSEQTPRSSRNKSLLFFLLLLIGIGTGVGWWMNSSTTEQQTNAEGQEIIETNVDATSAQKTVKPPFQSFQLKGTQLVIEQPSQASTHTLPSGTILEIPANAFVDATGNLITEAVEIIFKEYRDAAEIIASGIPMRVYNEDGTEGWMQTAGMFEMRASSEGEAAEIAEGQSVEVQFVSDVDGAYDFWNYDESVGNWVNLGASEAPQAIAVSNGGHGSDDSEEVSRLEELTRTRPEQPELEEGNILGFTDLDVSHIPELQGQNPVMLAYAGSDPKMAPSKNEWVHKANWFKKKIHPTKKPGVYELTLLGEKMYSIPVKKALTGADLERAKAKYAQLMAEYEANVALLRDREAMVRKAQSFRRIMSLDATGIYNYDILLKQDNAVPLMADFDFDDLPVAAKSYVTVYLITGDGKVVVGLPQYDWNKIRINTSADNKMLAVLPNDKVALFSQSSFEAEKENIESASGSDYLFEMSVEDQSVSSVEDLKALLEKASS